MFLVIGYRFRRARLHLLQSQMGRQIDSRVKMLFKKEVLDDTCKVRLPADVNHRLRREPPG
jgi:hypothetical protein